MSPNRISQREVETLPRWAQLALAARRAHALLPSRHGALDETLHLLDTAARSGTATDDLADAAARAYTLALDNVDSGGDDELGVVTCMAAHAAASAAEAATLANPRQSAHLVAQCPDYPTHAHRLEQGTNSAPRPRSDARRPGATRRRGVDRRRPGAGGVFLRAVTYGVFATGGSHCRPGPVWFGPKVHAAMLPASKIPC